MMRPLARLLVLAVLVGAGSAVAEVPDPTRPAGLSLESAEAGAAPPQSGVRMVILRHGARKSAAVINGQYLEVGDKLGNRRVVKISESEVVLTGESGREVIKVTPAIEKMPVRKTPATKPRTMGSQ